MAIVYIRVFSLFPHFCPLRLEFGRKRVSFSFVVPVLGQRLPRARVLPTCCCYRFLCCCLQRAMFSVNVLRAVPRARRSGRTALLRSFLSTQTQTQTQPVAAPDEEARILLILGKPGGGKGTISGKVLKVSESSAFVGWWCLPLFTCVKMTLSKNAF